MVGMPSAFSHGESLRLAALEQTVGLRDAGTRSVLTGHDAGPTRGARRFGDGVVAQHHRVLAQLAETWKVLGVGVAIDVADERQGWP
jgi:hypothetical protein